ncbi:hypothetical protein [Nonomuraea glycinis]|uniref:hypothetical protein n=1 Tax=Nonomuraea glycinis TaxID=2047744 RepID=UPI0033A6C916
MRDADQRRGVTVRWDDGGTTSVPPHRLKVVDTPAPYTPPRRMPEADPGARPDGADAYFSRPGHPGDAWVRYDETGDLDGWIRYNHDDPLTVVRYREVFNDPAWRRDVEAMGLREAAPAASSPAEQPPSRDRPSLDELIPASDDDVNDRSDEIDQAIRAELENREYAGFGIAMDDVLLGYSDSGDHGTLDIDAAILKDGRKVGQTTRILHRENGTLWVYNDFLFLHEDQQGKGFASTWNRHLEGWYRESGVERVEVTAALDAGGYVWALAGFSWRDRYEVGAFDERSRVKVVPRLIAEIDRMEAFLAANRNGSIPEDRRLSDEVMEREERELAEARALLERFRLDFADEQYPQPRDVAMIGWQRFRDRADDPWLGLRVMAGSSWKGMKWLT